MNNPVDFYSSFFFFVFLGAKSNCMQFFYFK